MRAIQQARAGLIMALLMVAVSCVEATSGPTNSNSDPFEATTSSTPGTASDEWKSGPPMPTQRSEFAAAVLNGRLYVAGGFLGPGRVTDAVERFDPVSAEWERVAPLPESRHHLSLVALDGLLYAAGGFPGDEPGFAQDVWAYDPSTDIWKAVADLPAPRAAHAATALGGRLYVVGGVSPVQAPETLTIYDPETDVWSEHPVPMPTRREHVVAVAYKDFLWVIGGRTGSNLATVEIFDPLSGSWQTGPELVVPTSGHTAAVIADEIHVAGGEDFSLMRTLPEHQVIGSDDDQWRLEGPMPTGRHGLGSGVIDDSWYVIGGGPGVGLSVSGFLEIWTAR